MKADIEPLEPNLWFGAIEELLQRQRSARREELPALLRHAFHLLQLTPRPLRSVVRSSADEEMFEAFLECSATASAALALVGPPMTFRISAAAASAVEARVCLPEQEPASVVSYDTASALVGAWAKCLVDLGERAVSSPGQDPALHRGRRERHRTPIRH